VQKNSNGNVVLQKMWCIDYVFSSLRAVLVVSLRLACCCDGVAAVASAGGAVKYDVGIKEENRYTQRHERSVSAERTTQLNWVYSVC
jgi:hypothetical protein